MSADTKQQALVKLDAFTRKIGYPDKWRDYSTLADQRDGYYAQRRRRAANGLRRATGQRSASRSTHRVGHDAADRERVLQPVAATRSSSPPASSSRRSSIRTPTTRVNYGAIGAVIGHEMTHGFDDQGRQFDAQGNLRDWWTKDDADEYNAQAQRVVDQFNAYTVVDTATHVNGKLTLGENIADLGGLTVAYAAMEKALRAAQPQPEIDGFTPEQRFFLGWAQVWRELRSARGLRFAREHRSAFAGKWRVNGPLSNMPEFKAAWGCKDTDPMVRPAADPPAHLVAQEPTDNAS